MQRSLFEGSSGLCFACWRFALLTLLALLTLPLVAQSAIAHAVTEGDKGYIQEISGVHFLPFMYLGAKHMITGYDHLLFLAGVIFFLYRPKHIGIYVTLFAIGHSTTMILGVYFNITMSSYLIDAIIGLSVVYKALDNMGAYQLLALTAILIAISYWRRTSSFWRHAYTANVAMMTAGFVLVGMHLVGYFTTPSI